jgi:hypothetical protein
MTLLDQTFFGNRTATWLIAIGISIALSISLEVFLKLVLKSLERLSERTHTHLDDFLVTVLRQTKTLFIVVLSLYIGLRMLGRQFISMPRYTPQWRPLRPVSRGSTA